MVRRALLRRIQQALVASAVGGIAAWGVAAEEGAQAAGKASAPVEDAAPVTPVGLDALLRLPPSAPSAQTPRKAGVGETEWRERFATARTALETAEQALATAQGKLESMATGRESWQVAAPGAQPGSGETGPLSFSLRQEIRRQREEVDRARRELDELRIEANLAGVPADWMGDPVTPAP